MAYCHTTEKLYYVVALPVEAAELAELTLRPGLGPGLGYQFVESEAMNLHGLMYSSIPPVQLLQGNSLAMISKIRDYRAQSGSFITFTIDAGPNIHLIYPAKEKGNVQDFIRSELAGLCEDGRWIDDRIGPGPDIL